MRSPRTASWRGLSGRRPAGVPSSACPAPARRWQSRSSSSSHLAAAGGELNFWGPAPRLALVRSALGRRARWRPKTRGAGLRRRQEPLCSSGWLDARVIHCRRSPVDVVFNSFKKFPARQGYACDRGDLVSLSPVDGTTPRRLIASPHDDRRAGLVAFCTDWKLAPERNSRVVKTPSLQVRQPTTRGRALALNRGLPAARAAAGSR